LRKAVAACDDEVDVSFCFASHFSNAHPTEVVFAAARDEDGVEVPQTDGATVLVHILILFGLRVFVLIEHIFLRLGSSDPDFIPLAEVAA
jgi:hypothetical protein